MTLIVEDGTGKPDANTYADVATVRAYAAARGVNLPADDLAVETSIIQAMDFLEAQRARYKGSKTLPGTQALQWPRQCVTIDNYDVPSNVLPKELISALAQCVMEISAGGDLQANTTGQVVKSERVDVLETTYMTSDEMGAGASLTPQYKKVENLLLPLYTVGCGVLRTVRV